MSAVSPSRTPYHAGERTVHERVGTEYAAAKVGQIIRPTVPPAAQAFLQAQSLAVAASVDAAGRPWASLLVGPPGFLTALDDRTVRVAALPPAGDPLPENLRTTPELGLLVIDLAGRRRLRVNGTAELRDGGVLLRTRQVYGNCPKYIQARRMAWAGPGASTARGAARPAPVRRDVLTPAQQAWVAGADTCFVASYVPPAGPVGGADASHRGGMPGFVRVLDERRLVVPDYPGNLMFNTLGNLTANPVAGLLFLDFTRGATLQLTGAACVNWDPTAAAAFPGAERVVEVTVREVVETADATSARWHFLAYSPFNPDAPASNVALDALAHCAAGADPADAGRTTIDHLPRNRRHDA